MQKIALFYQKKLLHNKKTKKSFHECTFAPRKEYFKMFLYELFKEQRKLYNFTQEEFYEGIFKKELPLLLRYTTRMISKLKIYLFYQIEA